MADRPIIFSGPMVRALLEGRKTQTRRVIEPEWNNGANPDFTGWRAEQITARRWQILGGMGVGAVADTPYATGDRLYVREAVTWVSAWGWRYRADNDDLTEKRKAGEVEKWKPSIHMPRVASRLTLTVTDVRVQRLQDISSADARSEGVVHNNVVNRLDGAPLWSVPGTSAGGRHAIAAFSALWNSLHGPDAWDENPWVVALTFTVARGNIDTLEIANA